MIPKTITKEHIIEAARLIYGSPVPERREAKRYEVTVNGHNYPPKYLISIASQMVTGHSLRPDEFGGGDEASGFLSRLGFAVHRIADLAPARPGSHKRGCVKIARAWLDMGITKTEFDQRRCNVQKSLIRELGPEKAKKKEKGEAFKRVVEPQFQKDRRAYYERLRSVSRDAKEAGADILVLPACAMMYKGKFDPREILGDNVPGVVASGRLHVGQHSGGLCDGDDSIILLDGQLVAATDGAVVWIGLKRKPFSIMAAVSSTIKHVRTEHWTHPPSLPGDWVLTPGAPVPKPVANPPAAKALATTPRKHDPVLLLDMGHNQYPWRYLRNTLRTVWETQSKSRRAVVILSSWHYKNAKYKRCWTWPLAKKVRYVRWTKGEPNRYGDVFDTIEVDLFPARKPRTN
jgi:hypothetical protein